MEKGTGLPFTSTLLITVATSIVTFITLTTLKSIIIDVTDDWNNAKLSAFQPPVKTNDAGAMRIADLTGSDRFDSYMAEVWINQNINENIKEESTIINSTPLELWAWRENENLFSEINVLIWVKSQPNKQQNSTVLVDETWDDKGKLLPATSADDNDALPLNRTETLDELAKTKEAFKYCYNHHLDDFGWFMEAQDDTFLVIENMKFQLSLFDPTFPLYFDGRFKKLNPQGYMSEGGGYILSRSALELFVETELTNDTFCRGAGNSGHADVELEKCLNEIGVMAVDTGTPEERNRLIPFVATKLPTDGFLPFLGEEILYWDYVFLT